MDELRKKGLEKMNEVYGWEMPDMPGDYFALTVDHLFGTIWTRPGLSMRDQRIMMLIGVTGRPGHRGPRRGPGQRRPSQRGDDAGRAASEIAIFLTHYVGFPLGSKLDGAVNAGVKNARRPQEKGDGRGQEGQRQRRRPDARRQEHP